MATVAPPAAGAAPPHNLEAEQSVLGAILLTDATMYGVVIEEALRPEDFYREQHRIVYRAMRELYDQSEPIDSLTLSERLRQEGTLEEAGGEAGIHALAGAVPAAGNVRHYAQIVKDNALMRRLITTTYEIQASVARHDAAPRDLVEQAERAMLEVAHDDRQKDFRWIHDILDAELDKLHNLSKEGTAITGTPSGFRDLDELTGGFQRGNLIVIAARPSMGKSALVTNIAEYVAVDANMPVALFSLEMSETELAQRFIASQARIKGEELRKGKVAAGKWPKILEASRKLADAPLFVDDSSDVSMLEVRAKARRLHQSKPGGLGLIIVDYLQLMRPDGRIENRVEQVGQMSRGLKILARELDVPVIALSQLNRGVEARTDKRPLLSDLRESGCLTGDSLVYLPDAGRHVPIEDLEGTDGVTVLAMNPETWRLERCQATRGFCTGTKRVFALRTERGREIRATGNHRFMTIDGWRRLDELAMDDFIAVPWDASSRFVREPELAAVAAGAGHAAPTVDAVGGGDVARTMAHDIYWDRIAAVEPDGDAKVYDLTVERLHNFVADGIVVHNSIEQDSDVVAFIYRDEYYNDDSEREGIADIIVAKHRNGPIDSIELTFQKEYPKFSNYARPDRYAA